MAIIGTKRWRFMGDSMVRKNILALAIVGVFGAPTFFAARPALLANSCTTKLERSWSRSWK
jgi:hypothetical protein